MTRRALVLVPASGALALVVLAASVSLGLRTVGVGDPAPLPAAAPLDYAWAPFGSFLPLRASYIEGILGGVVPIGGRLESARAVAASSPARPSRREQAFAPRVEVVHELTNDDRANALTIPSVPFTARTDTRRATREPGETTACGPAGGTVWYRYTPPADTGLIANTFGTSYSTTLGVFSDSGTVGCDTDVRGNAIVQFNASGGTTYWFQVAGPTGGGSLVFSLDPEGLTTLESVSNDRRPAAGSTYCPSVSGDGALVAFHTDAANLVPGDSNGMLDVFVRDRRRGTTSMVSVSPEGHPGNDESADPFLSGNGRFVAFQSWATNLVPGDTNGIPDVFVRDLLTQRTERVSVSSSGKQAVRNHDPRAGAEDVRNFPRAFATLSYDGRYVAFESSAPNLVPGDTNNSHDVFVHDRLTRKTERVSVHSSGAQHGGETSHTAGGVAQDVVAPRGGFNDMWMTPSISGNGRFVSFRSSAEGLVDGDDNRSWDLFVHDRLARTTERVAGSTEGPAHLEDDDAPRYIQNEACIRQALSFDGRYVAFSASPRPTSGPTEVHIFAHDRKTRRTIQVDVSSSGEGAEDGAFARGPAISADGRYVAFQSSARNLVPGGANEGIDVFVHDLVTRTTVLLSTAPARAETDRTTCLELCGSDFPSISADGRVVAFRSVVNAFFAPQATPNQIYVSERPPPAK